MNNEKKIAAAADRSLKSAGLVLLAIATWMVVSVGVDIARFWMSATIWPVVEARLPVYLLAWLGGLRLARGRQGGVKLVCVAAVYSIFGYAALQPELPTALLPLPGELSATGAACVDAGIMGLLLWAAILARRIVEPSERRRTWQFQIRDVAAAMLLFGLLLGCRVTQRRLEVVTSAILEAASTESPTRDTPSWYAANDFLARRYPHTLAGRAALWSAGRWLLEQQRYIEAIDRFERLLNVPVPSMEAHWEAASYRWYAATDAYHCASVDLSTCYESLGDDETALGFARLAQNKYGPCDTCGTAAAWRENLAEERVKLLEHKIARRFKVVKQQ